MYCTQRAAAYGKELQNTTSTCKGRIHVLHTACSLVYCKELQNITSTCKGRIYVLHTACSLVYGKELQNTTSICKENLRIEICISQIAFGRVLPARDCFKHGMSGMVYGGELILKIIRALNKYTMDANYVLHTKCPIENRTQTHGKFNGRCKTHTQPVLSPLVQYTAPSEVLVTQSSLICCVCTHYSVTQRVLTMENCKLRNVRKVSEI
jgi:hypothetical protein